MNQKLLLSSVLILAVLLPAGFESASADEIPEKYRKTVEKGLTWLVKQQHEKGYWGASPGTETYAISMTALAGMAFLMEGSTVKDGKFADNIRKAADWLMDKSQDGHQRDGLIGDPTLPNEAARYMYGHGFGMLFLASVYGEEQDAKKRNRLNDILRTTRLKDS